VGIFRRTSRRFFNNFFLFLFLINFFFSQRIYWCSFKRGISTKKAHGKSLQKKNQIKEKNYFGKTAVNSRRKKTLYELRQGTFTVEKQFDIAPPRFFVPPPPRKDTASCNH